MGWGMSFQAITPSKGDLRMCSLGADVFSVVHPLRPSGGFAEVLSRRGCTFSVACTHSPKKTGLTLFRREFNSHASGDLRKCLFGCSHLCTPKGGFAEVLFQLLTPLHT